MICLDTSVIVRMLLGEPDWEHVSDFIADQSERMISDFAWGEFVDVFARKTRNHEIEGASVRSAIRRFEGMFADWRWTSLEAGDVAIATAFILDDVRRSLKLPDALHLAIAKRTGARLITTDRGQAAAAAALGIAFPDPTRSPMEPR